MLPTRGLVASRVLLGSQVAVYLAIAGLSLRFDYSSEFRQRPILIVLALLGAAFVLHLGSLRVALRCLDSQRAARGVLLGGVLLRAILVPTSPIQEVDLYRYLWDGAVVAAGENPYRHSPDQVLWAIVDAESPASLATLRRVRGASAACDEALRRIHFGELVTVYPPVSQAVFGLVGLAMPPRYSLFARVVALKVVLVGFDLLTVWLVLSILRQTGRHAGWAILYAWSPLVLKEFANSGHLDAIAVCLTTGAVSCLLRGVSSVPRRTDPLWRAMSAVLLGLGAGAKLYPMVLLPGLALWAARRAGWGVGLMHLSVATVVSLATLGPMLATRPAPMGPGCQQVISSSESSEKRRAGSLSRVVSHPRSGLATFLTRWEINDGLFLVIVENLRPDASGRGGSSDAASHWFVIAPHELRAGIAAGLSAAWGLPVRDATFATARCITLTIFAVLVLGLLRVAWRRDDTEVWLRTVFLTLAWFWTLAPTQNPWYWTWGLPLLPFAGRWTWIAVSPLALVYYLRFWLMYHFPETAVPGFRYTGQLFFDFVVAPCVHGWWLLALFVESRVAGYCVIAHREGAPLRDMLKQPLIGMNEGSSRPDREKNRTTT